MLCYIIYYVYYILCYVILYIMLYYIIYFIIYNDYKFSTRRGIEPRSMKLSGLNRYATLIGAHMRVDYHLFNYGVFMRAQVERYSILYALSPYGKYGKYENMKTWK